MKTGKSETARWSFLLLYAKFQTQVITIYKLCKILQKHLGASSFTEFPSFQDIVLRAKLPNLVLDMCTNDNQSFVRASALKCLQEIIKVNNLWATIDKQELMVSRNLLKC